MSHSVKPGVATGNEVQEIFALAKAKQFALPAVNVIGSDTINAVLETAAKLNGPVTIETEYKNALKSKDKTKISTYRLILSSIKDLDISNRSGPNKKETDDEDIKKLLKKMMKQRTESIDIYKKNNRSDLLEIEQNEFNILSSFIPKQLKD